MRLMRTPPLDAYEALAVAEDHRLSAILSMTREQRNAMGFGDLLRDTGFVGKEGEVLNRGTVEVLAQTETTLEVRLDGPVWIGQLYDIRSKVESADKKPETVVVRINSGGGSAFAGYMIFNYLYKLKAKVVTTVDSLAASAAALVFLAGDERLMSEYLSQVMFHYALSWIDILAFGNRAKLEGVDCESPKAKVLQVLQNLDDDITEVLVAKSDLDSERAGEIMTEERFLGKKEALETGVATGVDAKGGDKDEPKDSANEKAASDAAEVSPGQAPGDATEATASPVATFDFDSLADCL